MNLPSTPDPGAQRFVQAVVIVLLLCQGMVLATFASHRSTEPLILGRYSPGFAALLVALCFTLVLELGVLVARWRRLAGDAEAVTSRLAAVPGLLEVLLLASGIAPVALWLFGPIVASILGDPRILWPIGVAFGAFLVLVLRLPSRSSAGLLQNFLALLLGTVVAAFAAEIALRAYSRTVPYRILPPGLENRALEPVSAPGIHGPSAFSTDELGIRGDPYTGDGALKILCIGGSTTMNAFLDDRETWPYLLQERLASARRHRVWVGNVGRSGLGLVEHIYALRHFVPQLEIDGVIVLIGANDLLPALKNPDRRTNSEDPEDFDRFARAAFFSRPLVDSAVKRRFPKNLAFWNLVTMTRQNVSGPLKTENVVVTGTDFPAGARRRLASAPRVIEELPDLTHDLEQFERNLALLIEEAARRRVRLIMATQPAIWNPGLSSGARELLWMGVYGDYDDPAGRYTVDALHAAMGRFNRRLLSVCRRYGTECVDLVSRMTGVEDYFYDDVHFTEAGARVVADILAEHLLATDP